HDERNRSVFRDRRLLRRRLLRWPPRARTARATAAMAAVAKCERERERMGRPHRPRERVGERGLAIPRLVGSELSVSQLLQSTGKEMTMQTLSIDQLSTI